jgi:hypothetical protein
MCNHLNMKMLIHIFTIIHLIMIIIIMRGENFVEHLDGLGGTPVEHHCFKPLSLPCLNSLLLIICCRFCGPISYMADEASLNKTLAFFILCDAHTGKFRGYWFALRISPWVRLSTAHRFISYQSVTVPWSWLIYGSITESCHSPSADDFVVMSGR